MERRNRVEQEKHPSLAQLVQDLFLAGDGQLAEAANLVEFLVVDGDPNASRVFRPSVDANCEVIRGETPISPLPG